MKIVKDLTSQLALAESKDKFYQIEGELKRLLAPQNFQRPFQYKKGGWGQIERVESTSDGTVEVKRAVRRKARVRRGEVEIKTGDCWTFRTAKNGDEKTEDILVPWATPFGILKKSLLRSLAAQRRLRYDKDPLDLIKVYPLWLNVGKAPCESLNEGRVPERVLETRHTQGGDVMVDVFFDFIEKRPFTSFLEVDSEAPINEERLVALLKTLNTLDCVGASRRGSMRIDHIKEIALDEEDFEKLEQGEPIQPVVY